MSTKRLTAKSIVKAIGNEHLELIQMNGYWLFIYDHRLHSPPRYGTQSVYVMLLGHLSLAEWVAAGRELVANMEAKDDA